MAVLFFWWIGAYNRVMRLRGALLGAFGEVEAALRAQLTWIDAAVASLQAAKEGLVVDAAALQAAARRCASYLAAARLRPFESRRISRLAVAQRALVAERRRLAARAELPARPSALDADWIAANTRFDQAAARYNVAIAQFPALLLASLMGFRAIPPLRITTAPSATIAP